MSTGTFRYEHIEENHEQQGNGHAEITEGLSRLGERDVRYPWLLLFIKHS